MNKIDDIVNSVIQNPEWLVMEYNIGQHGFINPKTNKKIATFFILYDSNNKVVQIDIRPFASEITNEISISNNGILLFDDTMNIYYARPKYRLFYILINEHFKECLKGW